MRRRAFLSALAPGLGSAAGAFAAQRRASPNIVLILADDLGYGDVGCYNPESKLATARVDAFARQGVCFTDAHSGSAVCSPTRYGLLTGRYAWRTRLKSHVLVPYDPPLIDAGRLALPEMLRRQGYHTACIGKWHLGWDWPMRGDRPDFTLPIAGGPTTRGFHYYFGTDVPNYPPYCFLENDRTVGLPTAEKTTRDLDGRPGPMLPGWRFEDILPALAEKASDYIGERAQAKQPFFLYVPLTSPHEPIAPSKQFQGKSGINPVADFILETDWAVGRVLDALDRHKLSGETLVIFTSDNGHATYTGLEPLLAKGHKPSGPLRGYKTSVYEGGHRVPFVARWPGRIPAASTCGHTVCLGDMMATCAELLGVNLPRDAAEDSFSMLPLLRDPQRGRPIRTSTIHHSGAGQFAIRQGDWKLVEGMPHGERKSESQSTQLFNLAADLAESTDLAAKEPAVLARLEKALAGARESGRTR